MCNCGIEVENNFLPESLATCEKANSKLTMYFTVNTAFVNYLDKFPNLTVHLEFPLIKIRTTFEQILPISLNIYEFDPMLLTASNNLMNLFTAIPFIKKFLICKKAMITPN